MAIPFFGPFVAWAPPVVVALFFVPEALLPALILLMGIGWFVVMNILQPRLMQGAVGIHPIVVLGSVLIGLRIAGIPGAIFGIPIAAVLSAFFFQLLERGAGDRSVAGRAAKRVGEREGRPVRKPQRARARAAPTTSTTAIRRPASGRVADHPPSRIPTWRDHGRPGRATGRPDGHDARASAIRAPGPRQGARRAPGRRRAPAAVRGPCARRPAARRVVQPAARSSSPTTTASSRAGCWRSSRRSTRSASAPSSRPTRTRAPSATRRPSCARCGSASGRSPMARWRTRWTARRPTRSASRSSAISATASTSSRPASTTARTWATTSPTRARSARPWRRSSTTARRSRSRRSTTSIPTSPWPAPPRPRSPATSWSTGCRPASWSTSTCRRRRSRTSTASRSPGSASASTRTSSSSASTRAGSPTSGSAGQPPSGLAVPGTDFHAVINRRIAVTPIHLDLTGRRLLKRLRTWTWDLADDAGGDPPAPGDGATEPVPE